MNVGSSSKNAEFYKTDETRPAKRSTNEESFPSRKERPRDITSGQRERSDVLQRVILLIVPFTEPEVVIRIFQTCVEWRERLAAEGFCLKTARLCQALASETSFEDLLGNIKNNAPGLSADARAFLGPLDSEAFVERLDPFGWERSDTLDRFSEITCPRFHGWLQAASQAPTSSFLQGGAASTAKVLGMHLVQLEKTLKSSSEDVTHLACFPDGKRILTVSYDDDEEDDVMVVVVWDVESGNKVRDVFRQFQWGGKLASLFWGSAQSPRGLAMGMFGSVSRQV